MKNIYRSIIFFTEAKYKDTPPSNIFHRASSVEEAERLIKEYFTSELQKQGLAGALFRTETYLSSDEEVKNYLENKSQTNRSVN